MEAYGKEVVGRRVAIRWTGDPGQPWFSGCVAEHFLGLGEHLVRYDDGDQRSHDLADEETNGQLRWLSESSDAEGQPPPSRRQRKRTASATADSPVPTSRVKAEDGMMGLLCKICMDEPRTHVATPCGHMTMCITCCNSLPSNHCPICRAESSFIKVIYA